MSPDVLRRREHENLTFYSNRSYVPVSGGFENKVSMVEEKIRNSNRTEQSTIQVVIKQYLLR